MARISNGRPADRTAAADLAGQTAIFPADAGCTSTIATISLFAVVEPTRRAKELLPAETATLRQRRFHSRTTTVVSAA